MQLFCIVRALLRGLSSLCLGIDDETHALAQSLMSTVAGSPKSLFSCRGILPTSVILGLFTLLKKRYSLPSDCLSSCVPCILAQNHCLRRCHLEFFTFVTTHSVD